MTEATNNGVWFVYDGDCPVCSMAAHALRIKAVHGPLHIVNAREDRDAPLLAEIRRRELNLDEGMVIICDGRFYHGEEALRFMARYADSKGWFNRFNRTFFQSQAITRLSYPWMRGARNLLLRLRGVSRIDNLRNVDEPVFKPVFGNDWERLPTVMRRHYANRAFRDDIVTVQGNLNVVSSRFGRMLKPLFRLTRTLVPYEGENVPITVDFITDTRSNAFRFNRVFYFSGRKPYHFRSAMIPTHGNELIERMGPGLCWRVAYAWTGEKVVMTHRGYALRMFGVLIPLPLTMIMGAGYAEEVALSGDEFSMMTEIRHPLWGKVFGYNGTFKVMKDA